MPVVSECKEFLSDDLEFHTLYFSITTNSSIVAGDRNTITSRKKIMATSLKKYDKFSKSVGVNSIAICLMIF